MIRGSWQLAQYMRRIGLKQGDPPQLRPDVQAVQIVNDARELSPQLLGPHGSCGTNLLTPQAAAFAAVQVVAGSNGVWVVVELSGLGGNCSWEYVTFPNFASAPVLIAGLTGTLRPSWQLYDFAQGMRSFVVCGSAAAALAGTDRPTLFTRQATAQGDGVTRLGVTEPMLWLAPGVCLHVQSSVTIVNPTVSVTAREPTDAQTPA